MGIGQGFLARLIKGLGSGWRILNLFKFDPNPNSTRPDLLPSSILNQPQKET